MTLVVWITLAFFLFLGSFGIAFSFTTLISLLLIFIGYFATLRWLFLFEADSWWNKVRKSHVAFSTLQIPSVYDAFYLQSNTVNEKNDKRITGSSLIDEQLQELLSYVIRDFVKSWYDHISDNQIFANELHKVLQMALVSLSNKCKSMDWASFLTTQLVDDVTEHIRLFRETRALVRNKNNIEQFIDQFFNKEAEKERDKCRDQICLKPDAEKDYLSDITELMLYFLVPSKDFASTPLRVAAVEILVSFIILPFFHLITDPDYINTLIMYSCMDIPISNEVFINVIKSSTNELELQSVRNIVYDELRKLRSQDSGGREQGTEVKQQIGSLEFVLHSIESQISRIDKGSETDSLGIPANFVQQQMARGKLFMLPLEAVLKNSLTLDHFLNYTASLNCQHYVNLFLNIECWKTSVNEKLCALELERLQHMAESFPDSEGMPDVCFDHFSINDLSAYKKEADIIYEQYLSEKAKPRVVVDDSIVKRLILRLRSEKVSEKWFDEVQLYLFNTMKDADIFLPGFRRSVWYIRLLAELDLLKDMSKSDDEDSQSLDNVSITSLDQDVSKNSSECASPQISLHPTPSHSRTPSLGSTSYTIIAKFDGIDLAAIPFPSKKMLNNLAMWFLEKRRSELKEWLNKILSPATLQSHPGLQDIVHRFLDPSPYQICQQQKLVRKVEDNFVAPLRSGVKNMSDAVKSVPDTVINTVDGMVDGIYKRLMKNPYNKDLPCIQSDVSSRGSFDLEGEDNIPLRILLQLMDEVFDLGHKDLWFRRRVVLFLKQILKAMFGDIVNRRIVDFVGHITSPERVAEYIKLFKKSFWPNGSFLSPKLQRDNNMKLRTQVAARMSMLSSISDELKAVLGSQTTTKGVLLVYECLQWPTLNKRLTYVVLESLLDVLLPNQGKIHAKLKSLHSSSCRVASSKKQQSRR